MSKDSPSRLNGILASMRGTTLSSTDAIAPTVQSQSQSSISATDSLQALRSGLSDSQTLLNGPFSGADQHPQMASGNPNIPISSSSGSKIEELSIPEESLLLIDGVRDLQMTSNEPLISQLLSVPSSPTKCGPNKENAPPRVGQIPKVGSNDTSFDYNSNNNFSNGTKKEMTMEDYGKLNDPKVKRLVDVAQLYFFDYYFDLLTYVHARQQRLLKAKTTLAQISEPSERNRQLSSYLGRERVQLRKRRVKLKYHDFKILTQVGQGGYGQVYLARKSDTKEVCALKVLNKKLLQKLDEVRHILTERDILTASKSPWLVKLLYAFQDPENVYLAMEFVPGGDYRTLLNNTGILNPRHTRFYISEMFSSLNALHKLGYIHRDLKPENFLIDSSGHIKLTDFGLASGAISKERVESMRIKLDALKDLEVPFRSVSERQRMYRSLRASDINYAHSVVGSPDYMALEVLQGRKYDYTIDYWSLGCMLFETLAGYPPFAGSTPDETYANLQNWKRSLHRPQYEDGRFVFSDRTWDLIQRLITSPRYRFQSFEEIQAHSYFSDVHWETLRQSTPPFIPQLDNETDAGYFDDFSNESDMAKYKEVLEKRSHVESLADRGVPLPSRAFIGFTFKHQKLHNNGNSGHGGPHGNVLDEIPSIRQTPQRSFRNRRNVDSPFDTMF